MHWNKFDYLFIFAVYKSKQNEEGQNKTVFVNKTIGVIMNQDKMVRGRYQNITKSENLK